MDTAQLVIQAQSGDTEAFGLLYKLYAPSMMKVIENNIHIHSVVQDVLHDGFIIAFTSIGDLKKPDKFKSWLTTIMKNLSLQYLRESANHISVSVSDLLNECVCEEDKDEIPLSWNEINGIIEKLPEGYGKIFRLAVLDGLSHKEIGEMLGIAPHSSSSQLARAKAMMRKLIVEHRKGMGVIGIGAVIFSIIMIWFGIDHEKEVTDARLVANKSNKKIKENVTETTVIRDTVVEATEKPSTEIQCHRRKISDENLDEVKHAEDSVPSMPDNDYIEQIDSVHNIPVIPNAGDNELLADNALPRLRDKKDRWSLSLAYNGSMDQNSDNRYQIPIGPEPDTPSEKPDEIEVTERSRHHMPLTIGLSFNYGVSSKWSVESGIRYTFLKSDFMRESEIGIEKTSQKIHYIGIPLKFNYRILGNERFSIYGQGGGALDIPVYGSQSIMKWEQGWSKPEFVHKKISAPLQWSVEGGFGLQYHITPSFGIYVEPSFRYYFNPGTEIKTIRQEKPLEFTIPIGIRINW